MTGDREQRFVFGEVAGQYDAYRPSYPDEVFDAIVEYGDLGIGARALEIGAGTGKATMAFVARGIDVHALEPSAEMAAVLRANGVDAEETTFEAWPTLPDTFDLVYAAQAWHWVHSEDRYERAAATMRPGATLALFWNKGRDHAGAFGVDNDAIYKELAPEVTSATGPWALDWVGPELEACAALTACESRTATWTASYTRDEWVQLLATHSDHRMLPEEQRKRLHAAVGDAIDRHGGRLNVVYDTFVFLARRRG